MSQPLGFYFAISLVFSRMSYENVTSIISLFFQVVLLEKWKLMEFDVCEHLFMQWNNK